MDIHAPHPWDLAPADAIALQKKLAAQIDRTTPLDQWDLVAGADVSYNRFSPIFYAVVLVFRARDWSLVEEQIVVREVHFPYIPGLLSFREAPVVLEAYGKLQHRPDVLIFEGQGIAHQRRIGIASHLGLLLGVPTLGCAKTRLVGKYDEPGPNAGDQSPLRDRGEVIGSVVRTKPRTNPVFVSVGHGIDLPSSVRLVLEACQGYRLPKPTRLAHLHANAARRRG